MKSLGEYIVASIIVKEGKIKTTSYDHSQIFEEL